MGFFLGFNAVMFYEHFLDRNKSYVENKHRGLFLLIMLFTLLGTVAAFYINKDLLVVPYFYVLAGLPLIFLFPVVIIALNPRYLGRFLKASIYFSIQCFMAEVIGLTLGHWRFDGSSYIGWVEFFNKRFPL